jgi:CO/xanthine dehydrogenase FAD-binding subunit
MYLALEEYVRPDTIADCLRQLVRAPQPAALLAGGTSLNVHGHKELRRLIDIQALPLREIVANEERVRIGAAVTLREIQESPLLQGAPLAALREAAAAFANVAIQNRSTIGGRIAVERPDQDLPPALGALGARLRLCRLRGDEVEERLVDYPLGAEARRVLRGALIRAVEIPNGAKRSALRRLGRTAVDRPLATVAAVRSGDRVRVCANLQGPDAADLRRLGRSEALVSGWRGALPAEWRGALRESLLTELEAYGDPFASGDYRRDLSATLALRAVAAIHGQEEIG